VEVRWFHGSSRPIGEFDLCSGQSDDPDMMFFSASCNVARRYGRYVGALDLDTEKFPSISVEEWLSGKTPPAESFLIKGDPESFDFPVDTLVLREAPGALINPIRREDWSMYDDGRAIREPTSKRDREWQLFVDDVYAGDVAAWERDNTQAELSLDFG